MNHKDRVVEKLRKYRVEDIIITSHARESMLSRELTIAEVKENLLNPDRLTHAIKQIAELPNKEKYECYFDYGEMRFHRYIITINHKCVVCTVMNPERRWRQIAEQKCQTEV